MNPTSNCPDTISHFELCKLMNFEVLCTKLTCILQVVNIVSGELNNAAAKKLDLEAWFPGSSKFSFNFILAASFDTHKLQQFNKDHYKPPIAPC